MDPLGELRVVAGIAHHRLVQSWIAVLGHLLIDAPAKHQIAPEQQLQGWRFHSCRSEAIANTNRPRITRARLSCAARETGITGTTASSHRCL
jgi:hypothetical protein